MQSWPTPHIPLVPGHGRPLRLSAEGGGSAAAARGRSASIVVCATIRRAGTSIEQLARLVAADLVVRSWLDVGVEVTSLVVVGAEREGPAVDGAGAAAEPGPEALADFALEMTTLGIVAPDALIDAAESRSGVITELERLLDGGQALLSADVPGGVTLGAQGSAVVVGARTRSPDAPGGVERAEDLVVWLGPLPPRTRKGPPRPGERPPSGDGPPGKRTAGERPSAGEEGVPTVPMMCAVAVLVHLSGACDVLLCDAAEPGAAHEAVALLRVLTGSADPVRSVLRLAPVHETSDGRRARPPSLVVSDLLARDVPPTAIRLMVLASHHRQPPAYGPEELDDAEDRLHRWTAAVSGNGGPAVDGLLEDVRAALADDLDAPRALRAVDAWADRALSYGLPGGIADADMVEGAPGVAARAVDALLGVRL